MADLKGNVAIITGSSSGIGAGIAEHLASLGCRLTLTARRPGPLEQVKRACLLRGLQPDQVLTVTADLCNAADLDRIVSATAERFGQINYLINNAGVVIFKGVRIMTEDEFDTTFNTNLKAVQFLSKRALPYLIQTKGNIVNISSAGSEEISPWCAAYCMSKAALDLLTKCMAADFASDGVRVNAIKPGLIRTPMVEGTGVDELSAESVSELNLVGRMGEVGEIARLVAYLCADDSGGFMTGSCLLIDGGHLAQRHPAPSMRERVRVMMGHTGAATGTATSAPHSGTHVG